MKPKLLLPLLACFGFINANATIIPVPGTFQQIQSAIDAAYDGDTVVVAPGTYFENINFRGKKIMVTSLYYLAEDTAYITGTIINGSMPAHPDTGSCVIFSSGEDSTSILQGFKITGGTGTKWTDIHGAGVYREGGGILIELSSPVVRHNYITGNSATNVAGVISAGGGGIRVGDGNPSIVHNLITYNESRYGAGIVLNYTGAVIRNNIIAINSGGQDYYGGSGIWILGNLASTPKIIENNTIVNNQSVLANGTGGILVWQAADVTALNNIIYGNTPTLQIRTISAAPQVSFSNVQGGFSGTGNIDADPLFLPYSYQLQSSSPCIDAGDSDPMYADLEDLFNPGNALYPSLGQLRNDMGAFGGQHADIQVSPYANPVGIEEPNNDHPIQIFPNPFIHTSMLLFDHELRNASVVLYDVRGREVQQYTGISGKFATIRREGITSGLYMIVVMENNRVLVRERMVIR